MAGIGGAPMWIDLLLATSLAMLIVPTLAIFLRMRAASRRVLVTLVPRDSELPSVTVVIATYNEAKVIARKLNEVAEINYPIEKLEVVVIDSASPDGTADIARRALRDLPGLRARVLQEETRSGKSGALTKFLGEFEGDVLCLTDADARLDADAVRFGAAHFFRDPEVGGVTGRLYTLNPESAAGRTEPAYRDIYHLLRNGESERGGVFIFNGPVAFFRRSAVTRFYPGADDTGTAMLVVKAGYRTVYEPGAKAYEYTPVTWKARWAQKKRRANNIVDTLLRNLDVFRRATPPGFKGVVAQNLFLHVASPLLFTVATLSAAWFAFARPYVALACLAATILLLAVPAGRKIVNVGTVFVEGQLMLLAAIGAFVVGNRHEQWETIAEVRPTEPTSAEKTAR